MGQSASQIRNAAESEDEKVKAELEERLSFLHKAALNHLEVKKHEIMSGSENNLKIHGGTDVEEHMKIRLNASSDESQLTDAIGDIFSGDVLDGLKKVVVAATESILGNGAVGEVEEQDYEIVWYNNALVRIDFYLWRYNFSSKGVIQDVENVLAYYAVKRVLDWDKVDPQVVTYCISNLGLDKDDILSEIDAAVEVRDKIRSSSVKYTV